jgi:hypothetical protein
MQALWQQAQVVKVSAKPAAPAGGYETTYKSEFIPKAAGGTR